MTLGAYEAFIEDYEEKVAAELEAEHQAELAARQAALAYRDVQAGHRLPPAEDWKSRAACHSLIEFFYPPRGERAQERERRETRAKEVCARCAVRSQCLEYALEHREADGIWGGLTEKERKAWPGQPLPSARKVRKKAT